MYSSPLPRLLTVTLALVIIASFTIRDSQATQDPLPLAEISTFAKVFETIKNNYVEDISDEELLQAAVRGMLSGLDPHSALLDNRLDDVRSETSGRYGGLGIEVTKDNGGIRVISPIDETPAQAAGIQPNDLIVRLDDRPVNRMSLADAVGIHAR